MKRFVFVIVLAGSLAACATRQVAPVKTPGPHSRPFIEESAISYPEKSKDFTFAYEKKFPQAFLGIGLLYTSEEFPDATINIYVYPYGSAPVEQALDAAMNEVKSDIRQAAAMGIYSDVKFGPIKNVGITLASGEKLDGGLNIPAETLAGKEFPLTYTIKGMPSRSAAFVFYRYMYFIKFRISAPLSSQEDPEVIGQKLAQEVARHINVESGGGCYNKNTNIDIVDKLPADNTDQVSADGHTILLTQAMESNADELANLLAISAIRIKADGCAGPTLDKSSIKPEPGKRVEWLKFTAGDWNGGSK